jgi:hypothetical protein
MFIRSELTGIVQPVSADNLHPFRFENMSISRTDPFTFTGESAIGGCEPVIGNKQSRVMGYTF